jgi:hypothetical protein
VCATAVHADGALGAERRRVDVVVRLDSRASSPRKRTGPKRSAAAT